MVMSYPYMDMWASIKSYQSLPQPEIKVHLEMRLVFRSVFLETCF